jgi:hypothetical protein
MREKRREWIRTIEQAKVRYWKEFLDSVGSGHLWKTVRYIKFRDRFANIFLFKIG